jgi:hypothetical protein
MIATPWTATGASRSSPRPTPNPSTCWPKPSWPRTAAILDAALSAGHPLSARIAALLDEQAAAIADRDAQSWQAVASTRVEFEEMHQ